MSLSYISGMKPYNIFNLFFCLMLSQSAFSENEEIVLHDAHIHYSQDMWDILPVDQALKMMKEAGVNRALVSATPTEGAEKLFKADPDLVIPMLRPYKSWRHRFTWFKDPELKSYLLEHLKRIAYRGFGEFHVFGEDADTQAVAQMIALAQERNMPLHAHTDLLGMNILLRKASGLAVIWAHGGFDVATEKLEALLKIYPEFYIELSYREGMMDESLKLTPEWNALLNKYQKRFLVGMDTYKPSRWVNLPENTAHARVWLKQLPENVAADIARNNLDYLFPVKHNKGLYRDALNK